MLNEKRVISFHFLLSKREGLYRLFLNRGGTVNDGRIGKIEAKCFCKILELNNDNEYPEYAYFAIIYDKERGNHVGCMFLLDSLLSRRVGMSYVAFHMDIIPIRIFYANGLSHQYYTKKVNFRSITSTYTAPLISTDTLESNFKKSEGMKSISDVTDENIYVRNAAGRKFEKLLKELINNNEWSNSKSRYLYHLYKKLTSKWCFSIEGFTIQWPGERINLIEIEGTSDTIKNTTHWGNINTSYRSLKFNNLRAKGDESDDDIDDFHTARSSVCQSPNFVFTMGDNDESKKHFESNIYLTGCNTANYSQNIMKRILFESLSPIENSTALNLYFVLQEALMAAQFFSSVYLTDFCLEITFLEVKDYLESYCIQQKVLLDEIMTLFNKYIMKISMGYALKDTIKLNSETSNQTKTESNSETSKNLEFDNWVPNCIPRDI